MSMKVVNEMALSASKPITVMLLEPYAGKLARTVLRGESSRKGADLLDWERENIGVRESMMRMEIMTISCSPIWISITPKSCVRCRTGGSGYRTN